MNDRHGTGATSKQMINAPCGAIFIWVNQHLDYPKDLKRALGRTDLVVVDPSWLENPDNVRGRRFSGIILDHAASLTRWQFDGYQRARERVV